MNKEEHYKNNPNDKPLGPLENKLMIKLTKLRHNMKVYSIERSISILLLKSQIRVDTNIKNMFEEMYPEEYRKALKESIDRHGATKRRPERKEEIIKSMNLKDRNILKENK